MLVFTIVLPWIEAMYKSDFCQLKMINSSNLFQIYKMTIKKNV